MVLLNLMLGKCKRKYVNETATYQQNTKRHLEVDELSVIINSCPYNAVICDTCCEYQCWSCNSNCKVPMIVDF